MVDSQKGEQKEELKEMLRAIHSPDLNPIENVRVKRAISDGLRRVLSL